MTKAKSLSGFLKLGVPLKDGTSNQAVGDCPFCGKEKKFYVNKASLLWDCKVCGESGNFGTFLMKIYSLLESPPESRLSTLATNRGLKPSTLSKAGVRILDSGEFVIPVPSLTGKSFDDLRLYKVGSKTRSIGGGTVGLFNAPNIKKTGTIYLLEGEWDCLAFEEMNIKDASAVSTSASVFKDSWLPVFEGRDVVIVFDHDPAGEEGMRKVTEKLSGTAKSIRSVSWSEKLPQGFDFRDLYLQEGKDAYKRLMEIIVSPSDGKTDVVVTGKGLASSTVRKRVSKWLRLEDSSILDIVFGTVFANRLNLEPVWMLLVGAPASGKSELLMSLDGSPLVKCVSQLSPKALISGLGVGTGPDPSLLTKVDGKILVIKDFTTILQVHPSIRDDLMATLRDAYDGKIAKSFGNGDRVIKTRFGFLAGTTGAVDHHLKFNTSLGERFLRWRIPNPKNEEEVIMTALVNGTRDVEMKKELSAISQTVLAKELPKELPEIPKEEMKRIVGLARLVAILRVAVMRDPYSKEVSYRPFPEIGTRVAKQFQAFSLGVSIYRGIDKVDDKVFRMLRRIAWSTIPDKIGSIISFMSSKDEELTSTKISENVRLPVPTVSSALDDARIAGIVEIGRGAGRTYLYRLTDQIATLVAETEVFNGS